MKHSTLQHKLHVMRINKNCNVRAMQRSPQRLLLWEITSMQSRITSNTLGRIRMGIAVLVALGLVAQ
jgi:hypothetical protein